MLLYKYSSTFHILENSIRKRGLKMINLLTNIIIFILRTANVITFGILDNIGVVYSILIFTTLVVFVKLDSKIQICDFWRSSGFFIKTLVFTGILFNALPQWYLWVTGSILVVLAYFLKPLKTKKSGKPSLLSKLKAVVVEEYQESDFKAKTSSTIQKAKNAAQTRVSEDKSDTKPVKKLPPV